MPERQKLFIGLKLLDLPIVRIMNSDTRFARNPNSAARFCRYWKTEPGLEETLLENGRIQRAGCSCWQIRKQTGSEEKYAYARAMIFYIGKKALLLHPAARTILFRLLRPYGFTAAQLDDILQNHTHSGRLGSRTVQTNHRPHHWILTTERNNQFSWHLIREDDRHVHLRV